jgi:hypothetical protein
VYVCAHAVDATVVVAATYVADAAAATDDVDIAIFCVAADIFLPSPPLLLLLLLLACACV